MKFSELKSHFHDWIRKIITSLKESSAPMIAAAIIASFGTFNLADKRLVEPNNERIDVLKGKVELLENRLAKVEAEKLQITVSPDGKSYILREDFDGSDTRWLKPGTFNNHIHSGHYYIDNKEKGYVYSTVPIYNPLINYDLVLDSRWVDGDRASSFGILLYGNYDNVIRFKLARNGAASVQRKSNGTIFTQVKELDVALNENSFNVKQILSYKDGVITYYAGERLVGKFDFKDFIINRVGVFVEGKQKVAFNSLYITEN